MDNIIFAHVVSSLPWYMVRACGFVAAGLLFILIISGIGLITGFTFRIWSPIKAWAVHGIIAISFMVVLAGHVLFLLIDQYQKFSLPQIFWPFGQLVWMDMGIASMYLLLVVVISSLVMVDTKKPLWKFLHYLSYPAIILLFFHALYTGTDLKTGILRVLWIVLGLLILVLMIVRFLRSPAKPTADSV